MPSTSTIQVYISFREETCGDCGQPLDKGAWITLASLRGALCLGCADLDHLVFLPSGNAALTRRAKKHSTRSAVVLKWSQARKRSERQGLLVEEKAIEQAEQDCLADADIRELRREREAARRAELDQHFVGLFAARIEELFPRCPAGTPRAIAEHACLRSSGRVGRIAAARNLEKTPVVLAVAAHIRHDETPYDELLAEGYDRQDARDEVQGTIEKVLTSWRGA